jgi:hypothetical protein
VTPTHLAPDDAAPGRSCPLHYRYAPAVFASAAPPHLAALDVLYVVGGLYGNEAALATVLALFEQERGRKRLVFNGDFHWFDAEPGAFGRIQHQVLAFDAMRGNVETELADASAAADAGCGCAYPVWVGDDVVVRSNRILARLRTATTPAQRTALAALPMWLRADVGALKLAVVHGDAESLAGWGFAQEHLQDAMHRQRVQGWLDAAQVDAFACTHTCLPVFQQLPGGRWVFNNGAAGMPNFSGERSGLITRFALAPFAGTARRCGVVHRGVHVDALAVDFDAAAFGAWFRGLWPAGSDAHASYLQRIDDGPDYQPGQLLRPAG